MKAILVTGPAYFVGVHPVQDAEEFCGEFKTKDK